MVNNGLNISDWRHKLRVMHFNIYKKLKLNFQLNTQLKLNKQMSANYVSLKGKCKLDGVAPLVADPLWCNSTTRQNQPFHYSYGRNFWNYHALLDSFRIRTSQIIIWDVLILSQIVCFCDILSYILPFEERRKMEKTIPNIDLSEIKADLPFKNKIGRNAYQPFQI